MMTNMATEACNVCGSEMLESKERKVFYVNGAIDIAKELRCNECRNLVYGRIRRFRDGHKPLRFRFMPTSAGTRR
jgi:hypothetical protein